MDGDIDVLIIGSGIAGLSLAAALADESAGAADVVVVEADPSVAYRQAGRSARQLEPGQGPCPVQELSARARQLLAEVEDRGGAQLMYPRRIRYIGEPDPPALPGDGADAVEIDAAGLQEYYRNYALEHDTRFVPVAEVHSGQRLGGGWNIGAGVEGFRARTVVNAAGAWVDQIAVLCGVENQGLQPYRHTAALFATAHPVGDDEPMIVAADEGFYIRPENGDLLVAAIASTPTGAFPAEARPEMVEQLRRRAETVSGDGLLEVRRAWTALRTSRKSMVPLLGYDAEATGFFWLAGQGGFGVQIAPAMAELAAKLILDADTTAETRLLEALAPIRRVPTQPDASLRRGASRRA